METVYEIARRAPRIAQALAPGYGWCLSCLVPWPFTPGWHSTSYSSSEGCLPLCEACWTQLGSPDARMPFYDQLMGQWAADEATRDAVRQAVLDGR